MIEISKNKKKVLSLLWNIHNFYFSKISITSVGEILVLKSMASIPLMTVLRAGDRTILE